MPSEEVKDKKKIKVGSKAKSYRSVETYLSRGGNLEGA